ncbi:hypothetical protein [Methanobrevibacter gottschalkii]|nr:hypothetical protein [Methanobrevibacter gottschalkii]
MDGPIVKVKRRPKREVMGGFKMSYRYKFYDVVEEDIEESDETSD